jgi:hypothetical protein
MPRRLRKKKLFEREQDRTPVSSPEVLEKKHRAFVPQSSPPRCPTRASHRQKPTCLVFGPLREAVYSDFFFCHNCKMYEDALNSGLHRNVDRNSHRFHAPLHKFTSQMQNFVNVFVLTRMIILIGNAIIIL